MELDFQKQKQKIAALSDAELIARLRNPKASATERMLAEAEISRRGLNRQQVPVSQLPDSAPRRRGMNLFSILIVLFVVGSVIAGILDDLGFDVVEWLRKMFDERGPG